jgi:membrane protease YdiL (CAAX protease family)
MIESANHSSPNRFLVIALIFEGGLVAVALILAWLVGWNPWYGVSLGSYGAAELGRDVLWGVAATGPAVCILMLEEQTWWPALHDLKDQVSQLLDRLMAGARLWQLLLIAIAAGLGEELLFRGLLQAGLAYLLPTGWALVGSLLIGSVLFGLCHYLSHTYFVLATLAGLYFGLLMLISGSLLPSIIAHALYDFVALAYLLHSQDELEESAGTR